MISGLHHYALEVPDLAVAEGFLQDFGLETGEKDGLLVATCPGRDQEQARLVQAPAKRLHHVTFTLRAGAMDAVREALERSGTPVIEPPPGGTEDGLWRHPPARGPPAPLPGPRGRALRGPLLGFHRGRLGRARRRRARAGAVWPHRAPRVGRRSQVPAGP